jgi:hypothetical protein
MHEETYTAKHVLDLYLEFEGLQPDQDTWDEDELHGNPPRFYRFKALKSLFRAFDLGEIQKFAEGTYILKRKIEQYSTLTKRMKSELERNTKSRIREQLTQKGIVFLFKRLLEYRRRWDNVVGYSSGLYACSGKYRYAFYKIEQINSAIQDRISAIDLLICFLSYSMASLFTLPFLPDAIIMPGGKLWTFLPCAQLATPKRPDAFEGLAVPWRTTKLSGLCTKRSTRGTNLQSRYFRRKSI